jgi:hypothetical protein
MSATSAETDVALDVPDILESYDQNAAPAAQPLPSPGQQLLQWAHVDVASPEAVGP